MSQQARQKQNHCAMVRFLAGADPALTKGGAEIFITFTIMRKARC